MAAIVGAIGLGLLASYSRLSYARSQDGSTTPGPSAQYIAQQADGKVRISKTKTLGRDVHFDPSHKPLSNVWTRPLEGKIRATPSLKFVNATYWDDSQNAAWAKQQQLLEDSGIRNQMRHNTIDEMDPLAAPTGTLSKLLPPRTARINTADKHAFDFRKQ
jgi:hypothetical protein